MKPFLKELAESVYKQYGEEMGNLTIVFPNRRAGLFFRDYLLEYIEGPVWSPGILGIEDYILQFSDLRVADRITLIFELYEVYRKLSPIKEDFDRFYYWGELLLDDFDEADRYLVNARLLFKDLVYQKELDMQYDYLAPEQKKAILEFWSSFQTRLSRHQEDFLKIWKSLADVYQEYRNRLREKGIAYRGMAYRQIAENPAMYIHPDEETKIIFAGLNALNAAEEKIIKEIVTTGRAEIVWDLDAFYVEDAHNEAGYFLRKYRRDPVFSRFFKEPLSSFLSGNPPENIQIIGASSEVGQVKQAAEFIAGYCREDNWDPRKTAIVLPDEKLLFPALNSLPPSLNSVNVTMGYPLKETPVFNFIESLLTLHLNARVEGNKRRFYYKHALEVVKHVYFFNYNMEAAAKLTHAVESKNLIYIDEQEVERSASYPDIFAEISDVESFFAKSFSVLEFISANNERTVAGLEKEYIFYLSNQLRRLSETIEEWKSDLNLKTFSKILKQSLASARIPFSGEPLDGLQIMGALETRNLDFENIFLLSFNDGSYPRSPNLHSFIPFNLRKGYGLPTFEQQDAIYAYNFYRLLQRAKNVYIFYHTGSENGMMKEMSRYIYQLIYGSAINVKRYLLSPDILIETAPPITIPKTEDLVKEKLRRYLLLSDGKPDMSLTPSAINIYLDCRLKFYFRYIAGLYEEAEVREEVDPMVFGKLLHAAMENIYQDFLNKKAVLPLDSVLLKERTDEAIKKAFRAEYGIKENESFDLFGRNIIVAEVIKKIAARIIDKDQEYAPFKVIGLERGDGKKQFRGAVDIRIDGRPEKVSLKGIVDRIDEKGSRVRIIDYKTGRDDKKIEDIPSLFNRDHPRRNKAAMQTMLYSMIYAQNFNAKNHTIVPGIFNSKELFEETFDYRLQIRKEKGRGFDVIDDIAPFLGPFEEELRQILEEIFSSEGSFDQTEDEKKCRYCPYAGICNR